MEAARIPLFPLDLVLFPHQAVPLHIFELRYRAMVAECLEGDSPFGVVFINDREINAFGCTARIVSVYRRYDDGRSDILIRGERRFRLTSLDDSRSLLRAEVLYYNDEPESVDACIETSRGQALRLIAELADLQGQKPLPSLGSLEADSFLIASQAALPPPLCQRLLQMTSTRERIRTTLPLLERFVREKKAERAVMRAAVRRGQPSPDLAGLN